MKKLRFPGWEITTKQLVNIKMGATKNHLSIEEMEYFLVCLKCDRINRFIPKLEIEDFECRCGNTIAKEWKILFLLGDM